MLGTDGALVNSGDCRDVENDVFADVASSSSARKGGDCVRTTRLPPARAFGVQKTSLSGPPAPPLQWVQEFWGVSVRVIPQFPSELGSAHPWLRKRFEEFTAVVWGDPPEAHALNTQLVRYSYCRPWPYFLGEFTEACWRCLFGRMNASSCIPGMLFRLSGCVECF